MAKWELAIFCSLATTCHTPVYFSWRNWWEITPQMHAWNIETMIMKLSNFLQGCFVRNNNPWHAWAHQTFNLCYSTKQFALPPRQCTSESSSKGLFINDVIFFLLISLKPHPLFLLISLKPYPPTLFSDFIITMYCDRHLLAYSHP